MTAHDLGQVKGGIVTFSIADQQPKTVVDALRTRRINTNTSSAASTRFDMEARGLDTIVRASVHYLTTDEEIDLLTAGVEHLAATV